MLTLFYMKYLALKLSKIKHYHYMQKHIVVHTQKVCQKVF